jgi:type IV secretory pathway TraG/TraD family ATPase VirD4
LIPGSLERTHAQSVTWRSHAVGAGLALIAYLVFGIISFGLRNPAAGMLAALAFLLLCTMGVAIGVLAFRQIAANFRILYRYKFWGFVPLGIYRLIVDTQGIIGAFANFRVSVTTDLLLTPPEMDPRLFIEPVSIVLWVVMMQMLHVLETRFAAQRNGRVSRTKDRLIIESRAAAAKLDMMQRKRRSAALREKRRPTPELPIGKVASYRLTDPVGERLVIGPPSSGKGTHFVIPTLLTYPAAIVTKDDKGELTAVTARYRATFGKTLPCRIVYVLDPYGVTEQVGFVHPRLALAGFIRRARFNPFDVIDMKNERFVIRDLDFAVETIANRTAGKKSGAEEHFEEGAINVIRGVAYAGLYYREKGQARDRGEDLRISPAWVYTTMRDMMENPVDAIPWLRRAGGPGKMAATILGAAGDRERGSYITTALRMLGWLEDPAMSAIVTDTTINIDLIFAGLADVFIVLPSNMADTKGRWVMGLLKAFFSLHQGLPTDRLPRKGLDVLYLLDELGDLGAARPVQEAWSLLRGYGGRICAIFQTRAQQERYELASVFETAAAIQIFGTHDSATTEWLCKQSGQFMIEKSTIGDGTGASVLPGQRNGGQGSRTISQESVSFVTPEVLRELGSEEGIALVRGVGSPILFEQIRYFDDPLLKGLHDPNPVERKDKETVE